MSNTVPSEILDEITRDEKDQNEPPKDYTTIIITSSIVGLVLIIILIVIVYWFCYRKKVTQRKTTTKGECFMYTQYGYISNSGKFQVLDVP